MKKYFLLLILSLAVCASYGQKSQSIDLNRVDKRPVFSPDPTGSGMAGPIMEQKLTTTNIGTTWYDLQNYGSMQQRMFAYPDGTIGATWMMAFEVSDWSDRGIGYNYYDGSSWDVEPIGSIATIRTGWASYAPVGVNGEMAVGHALPNDDWVIWCCKRDNKGNGDWTEFTLEGPQPGVGLVWPAMVTSGPDHNTIHMLALTYGDEYLGQASALLYSRSTDGGSTWDIENESFDELDSDYFVTIAADGFAWAPPRGNTLAYAVGFDAGHGCIMKSTDNGDNWTFTEVYNCPLYPPPGGATPAFGAGDGSMACAIGPDDKVHLVYGRMRHTYDDAGAALYYPATDGVIYWNESMPALDTTIISTYTLDYLEQNGNLVGKVVDPGISGLIDFPTYYVSLTSYPQMVIDNSNRIFVVWSGAAPTYDNGIWNYRHIYGNASLDGGLTWQGIQDFNEDLVYIFSECVYPVMAPSVQNDEINLYFQQDNSPGIFVWAEQQAEAAENNITFMSESTIFLTGVDDNKALLKNITVSQNFPNPFSEVTFIDVNLPEPGNVVFSVSDVAGRLVHSKQYEHNTGDQLRIRFENQHLQAGIYYYTVVSGQSEYTGKMIVR